MQEESTLKSLAQAWAQDCLHQCPIHIFLVSCNPERVLREDPPEQTWYADLRLPGGTTVTLVLGQRRGQYQVERESWGAPDLSGSAG